MTPQSCHELSVMGTRSCCPILFGSKSKATHESIGVRVGRTVQSTLLARWRWRDQRRQQRQWKYWLKGLSASCLSHLRTVLLLFAPVAYTADKHLRGPAQHRSDEIFEEIMCLAAPFGSGC